MIFFCVVGLHGKADAQARRTRAETRRRREAYPLWYSDRRQRRMCLRPSVCGAALPVQADRFFLLKRKEGERFLFLKKRNKRHCGGGFLSEKRMFPAHPTQLYRKTDGFHMNRPFCVTHWRKQQERRKKAAPQLTFFCFLFFLERKGRPPISAAVQWRGSRPRSPPYPRSPPRPRCNGPYDPSE